MIDYPPVTVPVGVSATAVQSPMVVGVPSTTGATVCTDCGNPANAANAPAFLGMPGVDFWSFSTWPYALKVGTGVVAAYGVYKLAMR